MPRRRVQISRTYGKGARHQGFVQAFAVKAAAQVGHQLLDLLVGQRGRPLALALHLRQKGARPGCGHTSAGG
jgi:hypothetical protein